MNCGKAVEEVWGWREALAEELEKVPPDQRVKYLNEKADKACKELGIKCRRPAPRVRERA